MSLKKSPFFELRSGSVDTLLFTVKTTDLDALRTELVKRFEATPEFFADDVVAIDVRRLADGERVALADIRQMLNDVRMRPVGVVALATQGWAGEAGLPLLEARDRRAPAAKPADEAEPAAVLAVEAAAAPAAAAAPEQSSDPVPTLLQAGGQTLVIDRPLRSGQQIYAKGDLVVLAPVSHGAEIIAEGNIHIYAPLRGRALAGVHGNHDARIFCTCLEPELISIAGIYRTTENPLPADVLGKSVQIRLEEEKLMIEPLRLT
ncbi:septum site-determining protein MinC [Burkholderia cenocepacia]|uniref:Probable septum site-determining protein MinC n=1 Tax=Burkholderia cenocepacia (strain ATCC BAA-245 / DSM 16553 / LMG 16656 / NCTC 13227 / J2315 / CF5610) TaxID=216591 RepID=MINC_BURCJ|nr:septum site-determining protein MinC [Burkholderia cenocepacia]B4EBR1.1 RecName: Full=Probable septum site-determining protein MinC [Burkholderia cenocepacia J2315]KIS49560.1 septum site-determining protein MinC [Burkholderia cepacia]EPZ85497.1 septum site-determining protein MinC [Burkholderia cenocepacia K56-2Valvano]ERI30358.1 septum site-determining protein MinC [Burkholderia cenocepacia BC7]KKI84367.1 septum formation inhibitor [Burkholderia cenocepacia]MBO1854961.1 septum site-determ